MERIYKVKVDSVYLEYCGMLEDFSNIFTAKGVIFEQIEDLGFKIKNSENMNDCGVSEDLVVGVKVVDVASDHTIYTVSRTTGEWIATYELF